MLSFRKIPPSPGQQKRGLTLAQVPFKLGSQWTQMTMYIDALFIQGFSICANLSKLGNFCSSLHFFQVPQQHGWAEPVRMCKLGCLRLWPLHSWEVYRQLSYNNNNHTQYLNIVSTVEVSKAPGRGQN